ncbi:1397_t:CDS:1, partial [Funneliformis mosseae]
ALKLMISLIKETKEVQNSLEMHLQDLVGFVTNIYNPYPYLSIFKTPVKHSYKIIIDKNKIPMLHDEPNLPA